jgi:hypothetical protein
MLQASAQISHGGSQGFKSLTSTHNSSGRRSRGYPAWPASLQLTRWGPGGETRSNCLHPHIRVAILTTTNWPVEHGGGRLGQIIQKEFDPLPLC